MEVNSSSSNDSLLHPQSISTNSSFDFFQCFTTGPSHLVFTSYIITNNLLILPLCIFVLYLGVQRWRQQRSSSSSASMSHCDSFTYHMVSMELISVFGGTSSCCSIYVGQFDVFVMGFTLVIFTWHGQMFFHILTCVERYLAVVHPITYRNLRNERGIRMRNITCGCVWLLCFVLIMVTNYSDMIFFIDICLCIILLIIITFCSVSVLFVLVRPGPGEQGGDRERVDQLKLRAFYTIIIIQGVLLLRTTFNMVWIMLYVTESDNCMMRVSHNVFNLPCSLVLPVLFLQRSGKLMCCKNNSE